MLSLFFVLALAFVAQSSIIYYEPGPIIPQEDSADLALIPIGNCMSYQFDVVITAWCTDNWCSIFHVGNDDSFSNQLNQRMPGIWIHRTAQSTGVFHIVWTTVSTGNPTQNVGPTGGLQLNTVYRFRIFASQTSYTVTINDELVINLSGSGAAHCVSGQTCHGIYLPPAGLPLKIGQTSVGNDYDALSGTVSNIVISDCDNDCTEEGLDLSTPHVCQCQSTCGGQYCNTIQFVADRLKEYLPGNPIEYCGIYKKCCCSCPNCNGYNPFV